MIITVDDVDLSIVNGNDEAPFAGARGELHTTCMPRAVAFERGGYVSGFGPCAAVIRGVREEEPRIVAGVKEPDFTYIM